MPGTDPKNRRLAALFYIALALFNYPILSLFNRRVLLWGLPLFYLYLFGLWAALILLMILAGRSKPQTMPFDRPGHTD